MDKMVLLLANREAKKSGGLANKAAPLFASDLIQIESESFSDHTIQFIVHAPKSNDNFIEKIYVRLININGLLARI